MPTVNANFLDQEGNSASLGYGVLALTTEAATHGLIDLMTLGTIYKRTKIDSSIDAAKTLPGNNAAQAGVKLRIHYTDDVTGDAGFYSIPTLDLTKVSIVGKEVELDTPVDMANLVADINTNWASPAGNPITVVRAEVVTVNR